MKPRLAMLAIVVGLAVAPLAALMGGAGVTPISAAQALGSPGPCDLGPVNVVTSNYPTCTGPQGNGCIPPAGTVEVCIEMAVCDDTGFCSALQGELCGMHDGQAGQGGLPDVYKTQARAMQCGVVMQPEWESLGHGWGPSNHLQVTPMRVGGSILRLDGQRPGSLRDRLESPRGSSVGAR